MGRDTVAVSLINSGKSLVYLLPLLIGAMEEESCLSFSAGEGPVGLIVVPSRELAQQIFDLTERLISQLRHYPKIRPLLCMGGTDMKSQLEGLKRGTHILISTPGRLSDLLYKGRVSLHMCKILVLDEADRLLDMGFEDEIAVIFSRFQVRPQVVLCSACIPRDIQRFASKALRRPVIISLYRSEVARLKVLQTFEFPRHEEKLSELLSVMGKTVPPILVFCENKNDVDEIVEFLQRQGIDAMALHGGKEQEDRSRTLEDFRKGRKEVMVATDVAAKGLHFYGVQHVVNYDLPKELDMYIQRICRTGRDKAGVATTLISSLQDKTMLQELRCFLEEANQDVPAQLAVLREEVEDSQIRTSGECAYCGIKGHRKSACSLLQVDTLSTIIEAAEQH